MSAKGRNGGSKTKGGRKKTQPDMEDLDEDGKVNLIREWLDESPNMESKVAGLLSKTAEQTQLKDTSVEDIIQHLRTLELDENDKMTIVDSLKVDWANTDLTVVEEMMQAVLRDRDTARTLCMRLAETHQCGKEISDFLRIWKDTQMVTGVSLHLRDANGCWKPFKEQPKRSHSPDEDEKSGDDVRVKTGNYFEGSESVKGEDQDASTSVKRLLDPPIMYVGVTFCCKDETNRIICPVRESIVAGMDLNSVKVNSHQPTELFADKAWEINRNAKVFRAVFSLKVGNLGLGKPVMVRNHGADIPLKDDLPCQPIPQSHGSKAKVMRDVRHEILKLSRSEMQLVLQTCTENQQLEGEGQEDNTVKCHKGGSKRRREASDDVVSVGKSIKDNGLQPGEEKTIVNGETCYVRSQLMTAGRSAVAKESVDLSKLDQCKEEEFDWHTTEGGEEGLIIHKICLSRGRNGSTKNQYFTKKKDNTVQLLKFKSPIRWIGCTVGSGAM